MSKIIGKRSSKWDLTSESKYQSDTSVSNTEVDDRSSLYYDNKSKSSWPSRSDRGHDRRSSHADNFHSTELKDDQRDSKNQKRSGRAYRQETSPPSRMQGREDDYAVSMSPGLDSWRKSNRNRSPGLDSWKESNRNRSHSPRNKWSSRSCRSRSRSRSPGHGFKREPERWADRNENGPKGMNKPCKDFASGRCKRGNQCRFLHDQYDGGKKHYDFALSGNREESRLEKRYSSGYSRPNNEAFEDAMERDGGKSSLLCPDFERGRCYRGSSCKYVHDNSNDGYDGVRHISHSRHERENLRVGDTLCKYFANGRCRNGDNCKFSHGVPGRLNPVEQLPNAKDVYDRENENRSWDDFLIGAKVNSEPIPGFEARSEDKQDRPEWDNNIPVKNTTSNSLQWQMQNGSGGFATEMSEDGDPHHVLRADTVQSSFDHVQTSNANNSEHLPFNNVGSSEHLPAQDKEGRLHVSQKPPDHLPEAVLNSQGQVSLPGSSAIQSSVFHEPVEHTALPPEDNTNLAVDAPSASNVQTFSFHQLGKILDVGNSNNHQFNSMATAAPSLATIEELPRATEPAALEQVLANGANLAKLYATLGSLHPYSQTNHQGSLDSKSFHHSNQYDPLSDSLVQVNTSAISQAPISLLCIPEGQCPAVEEGQNHSKSNESVTVISDKMIDGSNVAGRAANKEEKVLFMERKETAEVDVNKVNKENDTGSAEDKSGDEEAKEEDKKGKSAKDGRLFKFALVAFVKEILKPTWREGQMSREAHKTIVKKVVDKITGSLRGPNIPQTQETIDTYLSHSKEKVSKLIQAYVEKYKT